MVAREARGPPKSWTLPPYSANRARIGNGELSRTEFNLLYFTRSMNMTLRVNPCRHEIKPLKAPVLGPGGKSGSFGVSKTPSGIFQRSTEY